MNKFVIAFIVLSICLSLNVQCAPQTNPEVTSYQPYDYQYKVEDPEKQLYFDKTEAQDASGKVR